MQNTIFIIFGIIVALLFLGSIAVIHIRTIRDDLNVRWYNLADKLQYRQDLIPNLIETVRLFVPKENLSKHDELINKTIEVRRRAGKNIEAGSNKMVVEHDLSNHIKKIITLGITYDSLKTSTNFLELKKEFSDIVKEINELSSVYNSKIRHHNSIIKRPYNVLPAVLMRYKRKFIFDFE